MSDSNTLALTLTQQAHFEGVEGHGAGNRDATHPWPSMACLLRDWRSLTSQDPIPEPRGPCPQEVPISTGGLQLGAAPWDGAKGPHLSEGGHMCLWAPWGLWLRGGSGAEGVHARIRAGWGHGFRGVPAQESTGCLLPAHAPLGSFSSYQGMLKNKWTFMQFKILWSWYNWPMRVYRPVYVCVQVLSLFRVKSQLKVPEYFSRDGYVGNLVLQVKLN